MALKTVKATLNGTEYTLTLNSSTRKYEANITAPSRSSWNQDGHVYGISVTATDDAGNSTTVNQNHSTLGSKLKLTVKENVAPEIKSLSITEGSTITSNMPTVTFDVTDNDSGVKISDVFIVIDGESSEQLPISSYTAITGGYSCTFTPSTAFTDGAHKIQVVAFDNNGNQASKTVNFKIDTTPPTLSVSSPANNLVTNQSTVTVVGTTNDATSSPVTLKINGTAVTVSSNGSFTHNVTLTEGSNTITIVATDAAGKSSTVTRTVVKNTSAPTFSDISITPNPVNTSSVFKISVTVSDS